MPSSRSSSTRSRAVSLPSRVLALAALRAAALLGAADLVAEDVEARSGHARSTRSAPQPQPPRPQPQPPPPPSGDGGAAGRDGHGEGRELLLHRRRPRRRAADGLAPGAHVASRSAGRSRGRGTRRAASATQRAALAPISFFAFSQSSRKRFEADVGQRVLEEAGEHGHGHGADVGAHLRRLHHVHGMAQAGGQDLAVEVVVVEDLHDVAPPAPCPGWRCRRGGPRRARRSAAPALAASRAWVAREDQGHVDAVAFAR